MKTKKFEKKLELNKTTIAGLGKDEVERVKGGVVPETLPPGFHTCLWNETGCVT
jgi:hypothetical protein